MSGRHAGDLNESDADAPRITVIGGNPNALELAAVTAVITALAHEQSLDGRVEPVGSVNAWQRSQRPLRSPLTPGAGAWRGFCA